MKYSISERSVNNWILDFFYKISEIIDSVSEKTNIIKPVVRLGSRNEFIRKLREDKKKERGLLKKLFYLMKLKVLSDDPVLFSNLYQNFIFLDYKYIYNALQVNDAEKLGLIIKILALNILENSEKYKEKLNNRTKSELETLRMLALGFGEYISLSYIEGYEHTLLYKHISLKANVLINKYYGITNNILENKVAKIDKIYAKVPVLRKAYTGAVFIHLCQYFISKEFIWDLVANPFYNDNNKINYSKLKVNSNEIENPLFFIESISSKDNDKLKKKVVKFRPHDYIATS